MSRPEANRIDELLRRIARLPQDEIHAFLDEHCADEPELRAVVEGRLRTASGEFSDPEQLETLADSESFAAGTLIGPYRLLQPVGEGGMGVVYEAEQQEPVHRRVALKLIKWGMDTRRVVARFESERQALALMSHANIARVYDAGATERGRPYFVMEYVKGEPINTYCDRHRLTTAERLSLFVQVCAGVQHAHQRGIIHRDLKPSNVLVTCEEGGPVPKIIDFGVAKAISQRLTEKTLFTEYGQMIGTPDFMSPEQAEMTPLDVDTRSDVYSLGVLLYELLVGALPFESSDLWLAGLDEMRRRIREEQPSRPSTRFSSLGDGSSQVAQKRRTDPPSLRRQLRGDLDWITLKALEKDRTRRYDSASELAADIERHLRNQPVEASPPSKVYKLNKFVRRHRLGVGMSVLFAVLLVAFAIFMAIERARADREAATATQVTDFLVELFEVPDPDRSRGKAITAHEILERGAAKIEDQLSDQPSVQGRLMATMGRVYRGLGSFGEAERLLNDGLERLRRKPRANALPIALARLERARVLLRLGKLGEAEEESRAALADLEAELGPTDTGVAYAMTVLANALRFQNKLDEAGPLYVRALEIQQRALGPDHPQVGRTLYSQGWWYMQRGQPEEAAVAYERVLPILERELGEDSPYLAAVLHDLSVALSNLGRPAEARERLERALAIQEKTLPPGHADLGTTLDNLGNLLQREGRYEEARDQMLRAPEIREQALGPKHASVAGSLTNLGFVHSLAGLQDAAASRRFYKRAQEIDIEIGNRRGLALVLYNLGALERDLGDFSAARPMFEESLEIRIEVLGAEHPDVAATRVLLGDILVKAGKHDAARDQLESALAFYSEESPLASGKKALALRSLGYTYAPDDRKRLECFERALQEAETALEAGDPALAFYLAALASALVDLGNLVEAERYLDRARAQADLNEKTSLLEATIATLQGRLQHLRGDLDGARRSFLAAIEIAARRRGADHYESLEHLYRLGELCVDEGKLDEARDLGRRILSIAEDTFGRDHPWSAKSNALLTAASRP